MQSCDVQINAFFGRSNSPLTMGATESKTDTSNLSTGECLNLTPDNVANVLSQVKQTSTVHTKSFVRRTRISEILRISDSKSNEIIRGCQCKTDEERLKRLVEFWLAWCPYASWRWLIWHLDLIGLHSIAENLSKCAEPLKDPTLTFSNVSEVVKILRKHKIGSNIIQECFGYPAPRSFTKKLKRMEENDKELIYWWLSSSPFASWEFLAESLSFWRMGGFGHRLPAGDGCSLALNVIMSHYTQLQCKQESTCTAANVLSVLKHSPIKWGLFENDHEDDFVSIRYTASYINVPGCVNRRDIVQYFFDCHPCPSWKAVAHLMYCIHEYQVLERIHKTYLRDVATCEIPVMNYKVVSESEELQSSIDLGSGDNTAPELSVGNVVTTLLKIFNARPIARYVGLRILCLSPHVIDEILSTCIPDDREQLEKLVKIWLLRCPLASWRWLLWRLEEHQQIGEAMLIQKYTESTTDPFLTHDKAMDIFQYVNITVLQQWIKVPTHRANLLYAQKAYDHERKEALVKWWLKRSPFALSWDITCMMVAHQSDAAATTMKPYLDEIEVPSSLCLNNLEAVFSDVPAHELNSLMCMLLNPDSILDPATHLNNQRVLQLVFLDKCNTQGLSWQWIAYKIYMYVSTTSDLSSEKSHNKEETRSTCSSSSHSLYYKLIRKIQKFIKGKDFSTSLQDQCVKVIADSMTVLEDVELLPLPSKFKKRVELLMIV